jgi:hypothetical protein
MSTNPTVQEKKPRDTTNRLDVRMHKNTSFLAFAYRGNLYTFFPRGTFDRFLGSDWGNTNVKWVAPQIVTPILFGLLAYSKTPYKPSKGE